MSVWETVATLVRERWAELWFRTGEHLLLTGCSTLAACAIGLPLGILAFRLTWLRTPLTASVATLQTIPSLAMLACLLALLQKIDVVPALIALTLYALLPIVRNTLAGLDSVSPEVQGWRTFPGEPNADCADIALSSRPEEVPLWRAQEGSDPWVPGACDRAGPR